MTTNAYAASRANGDLHTSRLRRLRTALAGVFAVAMVASSASAAVPSSFQSSVLLTDGGYSIFHNELIQNGSDYYWVQTDGITATALTRIDPADLGLFTDLTGSLRTPNDATEVPMMGATTGYNCIAYAAKERNEQTAGDGGLGIPKMPKWVQPFTRQPKVGGGYNDPIDDAKKFLDDNGWSKVGEGAAKVGDIVRYVKASPGTNGVKVTQHFAVVTAVAGGKVTKIRSKWGGCAAYDGKPLDVPDGTANPCETVAPFTNYGEIEGYYTGGKLLKDPLSTVSLAQFANIPDATLKSSLLDTLDDTSPFGTMALNSHAANSWSYDFSTINQALTISPGDRVSLYAAGILVGAVTGPAASAANGGWQVDLSNSDSSHITFVATTSALLTDSISGFTFTDLYGDTGMIPFREDTAGSLGLAFGPVVPEPAIAGLFALTLTFAKRRRPA